MELEILWTHGKCGGEPSFITDNKICFKSGSFIKLCSISEYNETSIQGPAGEIQCLNSDSELGLIALGNHDSNIYVISYPSLEVLSRWKTNKLSNFKQICFSGKDYLLILEGSPNYNLALWNWREAKMLQDISEVYSVHDEFNCFMSTYPGCSKISVFQNNDCLHFFEIEDISKVVKLKRKCLYLPTVGDNVGSSILDEVGVESMTFFDKMEHKTWGIHSELLHEMPMKVLFPNLSEHQVVQFYDFLTEQDRLKISCHCWLSDKRLLVACFNGTILLVKLSDFSLRTIHFEALTESENFEDYISCMALNKDNLFLCTKSGNILTVRNINEWLPALLSSLKEFPVRMNFTPDYENLLFYNTNHSIILYQLDACKNDSIIYMTTCTDDSRIVGMFANSDYCVTARASGLVEAWELKGGAPVFSFSINEDAVTMTGIPSCSMLLLSTSSAYLYAIEFTDIKNVRIVKKSRPSVKPIHSIICEPYGRFAVIASYYPCVFIYNVIPSEGLMIQGYLSNFINVIDIAIVCNRIQDDIQVYLLGTNESGGNCIISLEIPADFTKNYAKYWENQSGELGDGAVKLKEVDLQTTCCCSIVAHFTAGLILCLTDKKEIVRIPYEKFDSFNLEEVEKCCEIPNDVTNCKMVLSLSHSTLLLVDNKGDVTMRSTKDFEIKSSQKIRTAFSDVPRFDYFKEVLLVEGIKGVVICNKLPTAHCSYCEDTIWNLFCNALKSNEDGILSKMKPQSKCSATSWVEERLLIFNQDELSKLRKENIDFRKHFQEIQRQLHSLAEENFSMPKEHQIESEEFVFDENTKEKMMTSRQEDIEKYTQAVREKLDRLREDVSIIQKEFLENMMVKGKILKSFREGSLLQNYSMPVVSENDKNEISYSYRKMCIEHNLQIQISSKEIESFEELKFDELAKEDIEELCKKLHKQPFQLQSLEERIDYVNILKYVIMKKRLSYNCLFDEVGKLRRDTVQNIKEINTRIKEILPLIEDKRSVWEPVDEDDETKFEVDDEEVENAISQKHSDDRTGLADHILREEWLLERKFVERQKYQAKLKKETIESLKKEADRKFKEIVGLVDQYESRHAMLVEKKLLYDVEINKDELQLYLILFSVANFSSFKQWERYVRKIVKNLENTFAEYNGTRKEIENMILKIKKESEKLRKEGSEIDSEVQQISKLSRNKQAFVDSYYMRPEVSGEVPTLNPYKNADREFISPEKMFLDMNENKNKPQKVPVAVWKQLCSLREKKFALEKKLEDKACQIDLLKGHLKQLKEIHNLEGKDIEDKKLRLQSLHEMRIRCNFETPMVLSVPDYQVEMAYPDDLDFRQVLFLRRRHVESLNGILTNAGGAKLEVVKQISRVEYQIARNEAKFRINKLKVRDARKEIDVIKGIPLTKDIQKIIQDPKGFSLQDKMDSLEKSKQMEIEEFAKQMKHVTERIASIEVKKDIFRRSLKEKKREIEKLEGDIAELRKIEKLKSRPK